MHVIFTIWHMYLQYNEYMIYILLKYSILVLQNQKSTRSSAVHVIKKKNRFCWLRTNWYHTCTCIIHPRSNRHPTIYQSVFKNYHFGRQFEAGCNSICQKPPEGPSHLIALCHSYCKLLSNGI